MIGEKSHLYLKQTYWQTTYFQLFKRSGKLKFGTARTKRQTRNSHFEENKTGRMFQHRLLKKAMNSRTVQRRSSLQRQQSHFMTNTTMRTPNPRSHLHRCVGLFLIITTSLREFYHEWTGNMACKVLTAALEGSSGCRQHRWGTSGSTAGRTDKRNTTLLSGVTGGHFSACTWGHVTRSRPQQEVARQQQTTPPKLI